MRRRGRYDWRDLCRSSQIASQSVTFAKGRTRVGERGDRSLESDTPLCDGLHSFRVPILLFFLTGPVKGGGGSRSASGLCAAGIWANVKWTIKKRSEQVIFLCLGLFSQNVSPGRVIPLHISSDMSCVYHIISYHSQGHFFFFYRYIIFSIWGPSYTS